MHVYNAWLPPPVRELLEADPEKNKFHDVVLEVEREWQLHSAESRFASLKWISVINAFFKARADLAIEDLQLLVKRGLDILLASSDNLFVQIQWSRCLVKILKKHRNKLSLTIEWKPFYRLIYDTHFKRRISYEGLALKQYHQDTIVSLVRTSRRFFPEGSVAQIWDEFRPALDDLSHNSALEAVGFISLFMPTNLEKLTESDRATLSSQWFEECLKVWAALPNSHYWDRQWASLLSRYIKHCSTSQAVNWDPYLPTLFTHILRSFEVPVGKSGTSSPVGRDITREIVLAFNGGGWSVPVSKYFAKAIVYLLKPGSPAGTHLSGLINLLEQYYHPSNGGSWTSSLERFLHFLVYYFQKRIAFEQRSRSNGALPKANLFLGPAERISFVKTLLPLIERGQYSKDGYMSETAAITASMLTYVEPSVVLPLINSRFHTALNTITATHQLESAVTTLALAARPTFLACAKDGVFAKNEDIPSSSSLYLEEFTETLVVAMFSTLLGMDANDPPKTLATMSLYSSILCNVGVVGDVADGGSLVLPIDWSQWLDEFLSRLFMLLVHLEPSGQQMDTGLDDGYDLSSSTFLMQGGSFYHSVIELLFGRLTRPLYLQALKKLAQFVHNNVLPGAALEIGLLCSFAVFTDPAEAISQLLVPIMNSSASALGDFPTTGFGGGDDSKIDVSRVQVSLSQAVETSVTFQLNVLSASLMFAAEHSLPYKALLDRVIYASFNAPSSKVNEAGNRLLSSLLGSLIFYYPLDQYKLNSRLVDGVEAWISTKSRREEGDPPNWHIPNKGELSYANALLDRHLRGSLAGLRDFCQSNRQAESSGGQGQGKEYLRVLFLRIDATLRGVGSCLPDFEMPPESDTSESKAKRRLNVVGAFGATVGDAKLRQEAAEILHEACEYLFKERADDTVLLMMLIRVMDLVGNCATLEHNFWSNGKMLRHAEAKCLTEPKMNFINNPDAKSKRRPRWLVVDMVSLHNAWRSSQASFRPTYAGPGSVPVSKYLALLAKDLLKLSLHRYDVVRKFAVNALGKSLKRFPILVKDCLPVLTGSLEDSAALEDSALGACKVLMLRPVLRHLTQDWSALSLFFRSLLKSAHHESVKAQSAINELFVVFSVRFGGLPSLSSASENADAETYNGLVAHIKGMLSGADNIHWRYNLMANGMLLLLLVHPFSEGSKPSPVLESRRIIAEQFVSNLTSELPALRPLSIIALLCLLQAWSPDSLVAKSSEASKAKNKPGNLSLRDVLIPVIQKQGFGGIIIQNLAFDHHYPDGSGRSGRWNGSRVTARISDLGLTALMPPFTRDWPRTRTWDSGMIGEAFSVNSAKLFKRLARECGEIFLNALRGHLEEVSNLPEERGKQCVAAEIIGGLLQSDVKCIVEAWGDWLRSLLQKCLMQATVESVSEWATCIRFSLTGKGGRGETSPVLRYEILECLAELLPATASTSLVAKRLMLLRAALVEYRPVPSQSKEGLLHAHLLREMTTSMAHPAPQVRENVGSLLCILIGNIRASSTLEEDVAGHTVDRMETDTHLGVSQLCNAVDLNKAEVGRPAVMVSKLQLTEASPSLSTEPREVVSSRTLEAFMTPREPLEKSRATQGRLVGTATVDEFNKVLVEETKVTALRIQSLGGPAFGGSEASTSNGPGSLENGSQDIRWMETVLYFVIACLKSGKAVDMTTTLIGLLHPLLSLQETSEKDLSALAKGALRLFNWHPIPSEHLPSAVEAVLGAAADTNWHTRVAALVFIQSFVYRHTYILSARDKGLLWSCVEELLSDPQVEVRELAATSISGMMKGSDSAFAEAFREQTMVAATSLLNASKRKRTNETTPKPVSAAAAVHGNVLGLAACVLSVPYDMPTWLPDMVTLLGRFSVEPSLIKSTVKRAISEFRRTHSDTWAYQKNSFSEEQLEVLSDLASSASYFA